MPANRPSHLDGQAAGAPYWPLAWVAVAAVVGVAVDRAVAAPPAMALRAWWAMAAMALFAATIVSGRRPLLAAAATLAAVAALAGAWHAWRWNYMPADDLARFAGASPEPACVEVVLADRVRVSPAAAPTPLRAIPSRIMSEATVRVVAIRDGRQWRPAGGLTRLRVAGQPPRWAPGDRLRVFAQLARPSGPLNPGEYDWAAAERRLGRLSELYCDQPECVTVVKSAQSYGVDAALAAVRRWCERQLTAAVRPADAPLVLATLLGDQERLSDESKDAFLRTGSIHLLVVSGAHVALVAGIAWRLARGAALSIQAQFLVTSIIVGVYAAIVGWQPSVMRAAILTVATVGAIARGRTASAGNLLSAAALAVIAYNPSEAFRAGTQFSFLAVAVLAAFSQYRGRRRGFDPLERLLADARPWPSKAARRAASWTVAMACASLAVGVALAPLVAHHFNVVTPASIVLTPLAGPLVALALGCGVGVVTVGWLVPPLGLLFGAVCGGALHLTERIVTAAQYAPGSYFYAAGPSPWWLATLYGTAAALVLLPRLRPRWPALVSLGMVWLAVGYASLGAKRAGPDELRCTFLALGHGMCAVLELPGGETLLYDAGSLGSPDAAAKIVSGFLWSRGIERIDAVVLSHADIDHFNAMPGLVERFDVGSVYLSPMMFDPVATDGRLEAPNFLRDALRSAGVPMRTIWMGDRLRTGDERVGIEVLHPPREGVFGRDNANSLLLLVEFAGNRVLLPGDLESPGLDDVIAEAPLDCNVLLAPHHGSARSNPPGFAAWCMPEWVVLSGDRPERTVASRDSYQQAGASVHHTASEGAVTFILSASGIQSTSFRPLGE